LLAVFVPHSKTKNSNNPKEVKEHPAFPYQKEFGAGTGSKQAIL